MYITRFRMNADFYENLLNKHQLIEAVPSNKVIAAWASHLVCLLYPELSAGSYSFINDIKSEFNQLEISLVNILNATKACYNCNNEQVANQFFDRIPELYRILNTDIEAILNGDPAAKTRFEVIRAYPGFYALCFYRVAHLLFTLDIPHIPRILTEHAHSKTGIDIHPAAAIDEYFHIDHGTGIVIGETAKIGKHVKLYQGVTLGAISVDKSMADSKRHPTVEDHVIIYSGATILGGETIIGHHSIIGGNVWLTKSVPAGSLVYHHSEVTVLEGKILYS